MKKVTIYKMFGGATRLTQIPNTQKIEFDKYSNTPSPDRRSGIVDIIIDVSRHNSDNPLPHNEESNRPDTGFSGNQYILNVIFYEDAGTAAAISRLVDWQRNKQTVDGQYDEGVIGITNEYRKEYDLIPNNKAGYKISNFRIMQDLNINTITKGVITLEFSGDPSELGKRLS